MIFNHLKAILIFQNGFFLHSVLQKENDIMPFIAKNSVSTKFLCFSHLLFNFNIVLTKNAINSIKVLFI